MLKFSNFSQDIYSRIDEKNTRSIYNSFIKFTMSVCVKGVKVNVTQANGYLSNALNNFFH